MKTETRRHYAADTETDAPKSTLYNEVVEDIFDYDDLKIISEMQDTAATDYAFLADKNSDTRVWGGAIVPVHNAPTRDMCVVKEDIYGHIESLRKLENNAIVWYHNLGYDVGYIITGLLRLGYRLSSYGSPKSEEEEATLVKFILDGDLDKHERLSKSLEKREKGMWRKPDAGTFTAAVTPQGVWYNLKVTFHHGRKTIELRDSLKILPFSLDVIAKSMGTKAQKLNGTVDYTKVRPYGYQMTETEEQYLVNDILVLSEALYKIQTSSVDLTEGLTIGGACMKDLFRVWGDGDEKAGKTKYRDMMPAVSLELDKLWRKGYRGGVCFNLTDGSVIGQVDGVIRGYTIDVNSLYPFVMRDHLYPIGDAKEEEPKRFNHIHKTGRPYIFICDVHFKVKKNHIPYVQHETTMFGDQTHTEDTQGIVEMTMTSAVFALFKEQHEIIYFEVKRLWWWYGDRTMFNAYIDKWYAVKNDARAIEDTVTEIISKLMLNNPYGKMSQSPEREGGRPYLNGDDILKYHTVETVTEGGFIPVGAFITDYARCVMIRGCQAIINAGGTVYYGDTDSMHFSLGVIKDIHSIPGVTIGAGLGEWKLEGEWDCARFVRQKTYIENIRVPNKGWKLDIKACGAPAAVKTRLLHKVTTMEKGVPVFTPLEIQWDEKAGKDVVVSPKRTLPEVIDRFTVGLVEAGKLTRRSVSGGAVLVETTFKIHQTS